MEGQATGRVKVINETQVFESGFQKREFVLTSEGQYPQDVKFELMKDNCSKLDGVKIGDPLTVSYDIRGNEYNGKYYVNLVAWKIETQQTSLPNTTTPSPAGNFPYVKPMETSEDDDLPF